MGRISGAEKPLLDIFCDKYEFRIPRYQRPYAWTEKEVGELFNDLFDYFREIGADQEKPRNADKVDPYFLGSLVLIKDDAAPKADVVDGQQRLTTLTILWAALASSLRDDELRRGCREYFSRPKDPLLGIAAKPRLTLGGDAADFFRKYVQLSDDLTALATLDPNALGDEIERRICKNARLLLNRVQTSLENDDAIKRFVQFLLNNCFFVVVSTPSQSSAFRIFSVLNNRGLNLLPCDVIKSEIVGKLAPKDAEKYAKRWESFERGLGRSAFNELFNHILMISSREKARSSVLELFSKTVLGSYKEPNDFKTFFDDELAPYCAAYRQLKRAQIDTKLLSSSDAAAVEFLWSLLNRIEFSEWIPVALKFLLVCQKASLAGKTSPDPVEFFRGLERLAAFLYVKSSGVNDRIARFATVLRGLENDDWEDELDLTPEERREFYDALNGDIYNVMSSRKRKYVLLRLDSFLAEGNGSVAKYDVKNATVEHVLPQTPRSEFWTSRWSDEERERWLHRLGNLAPLTAKKNAQAQNFDFVKKSETYFLSGTVSPFVLTRELKDYSDWTPEIVAARQEKLMRVFEKNWGLTDRDDGTDAPIKKTAIRDFQLNFWIQINEKCVELGEKPLFEARPQSWCEIRFGKNGVKIVALCGALKNSAALRIEISGKSAATYFKTLQENRAELEALDAQTVDWNASAPTGKYRFVVLEKKYALDRSNPENVAEIVDEIARSAAKYRNFLRRILAGVDPDKSVGLYSLESYDAFGTKGRALYDAFHLAISERFPDLKREFKKLYIVYKGASRVVFSVIPLKNNVKLEINLKSGELDDAIDVPVGFCENIADKGHWGSGDYRIKLASQEEFPDAFAVVAQVREKQISNVD